MNRKGDSREQIRAKALSQLGANVAPPQLVRKVRSQSNDKLLTILHVDDEPSVIELTIAALPESDYKVLSAGNVAEAIVQLQKISAISLVLLDIIMPGQDGYALLDFLQSNMRLRPIPVVMCSALAESKDVRRARAMGAAGYLAKPYTVSVLLEKIKFTIKSQQKSILLVSEEGIIHNILKKTFERRRCQTSSAVSGHEAIVLLKESRIDVVICDLVLVDGTGPDLLAMMRENNLSIPVFFLDDPYIKIQEEIVISCGADGILRRPLNGSDVYRKVTGAIAE